MRCRREVDETQRGDAHDPPSRSDVRVRVRSLRCLVSKEGGGARDSTMPNMHNRMKKTIADSITITRNSENKHGSGTI